MRWSTRSSSRRVEPQPSGQEIVINKLELAIDSIKESLSQAGTAYYADDHGLTSAGVMVLLYPKQGELNVLLNKRTNRVEHHKGEISFPGGARDPEDATILDTALRETEEEMGIKRDDVEVIRQLDQVSTRSGFAITPFVGTIPPGYPFASSNIEVAEILEVPLSELLDPVNRQENASIRDGGLSIEYAYAYGEHLVWGATARILTQFLGLVAPGLR